MDQFRGILDWFQVLDPSYLRTYLEEQKNWKIKDAALAEHFYRLLMEQVLAVVPISILLILVMAIFFGRAVTSPLELMFGILAAIIGLAMFIDALRVCVMPLSEQLGTELPKTLSLPFVLIIACFLGILVTYAEPAITTLRPLAKLVDREVAPYLYCILMETQETLVFCIGLGVGCAATLGTLRFVKGWSLKPLILIVLSPTLMCAIYMWWGNKELRPLLGLAWDCGAVTTGPVTVPVLLALGIGVMKTKREQDKANLPKPTSKKQAKHRHTKEVKEAAQDALEGFGIVTLASLLPVLAVEILSISLTFIYTHEDILANKPVESDELSLLDVTPFREVYYSSRAILPLIFCLIVIVTVILKKPIPQITFYLKPEEIQPRKSISRDRTSKSMSKLRSSARRSMEYGRAMLGVRKAAATGSLTVWSQTISAAVALGTAQADELKFHQGEFDANRPSGSTGNSRENSLSQSVGKADSEDLKKLEEAFSGELEHGDHYSKPDSAAAGGKSPDTSQHEITREGDVPTTPSIPGSSVSLNTIKEAPVAEKQGVSIRVTQESAVDRIVTPGDHDEDPRHGMLDKHEMPDEEFGQAPPPPAELQKSAQDESTYWNWVALFAGVAEALFGMILFSIGLTYGFTSIGDQVGTLLPAAFIDTDEEPSSPYYDYGAGVTIALGTMFSLGFMATRAEPALNVVGQTVEKLSRGSFTCNMLVYSVCVGVGVGMVMGSTKILFGFPLIWFILLKYAVALCLSAFANEDFINIAWDSAGVTTGPVTVPFVLSTGVGCSKAVKASEGFGILACASVWPIITVLVVDSIRRAMKKAKTAAAPVAPVTL